MSYTSGQPEWVPPLHSHAANPVTIVMDNTPEVQSEGSPLTEDEDPDAARRRLEEFLPPAYRHASTKTKTSTNKMQKKKNK
jgi:hypothetical protein